ncbi:hypothetical protein ISS37_10610 [candidate division KSB1 bacterium]|nr:hypothetical protein [candidate division KSB1 bacterium]
MFTRSVLETLIIDDRVDKDSLAERLDRIQKHLCSNNVQRAADLATELRVASIFLNLNELKCIVFCEKPDLRCTIHGYDVSIEIRKFRFKSEDVENQKRLEQALEQGELVDYGNLAYFVEFVEDALKQKILKALDKSDYYLYLLSESTHQIEDVEIKIALKDIIKRDTGLRRVAGLFYQTLNRPVDTSPIRFVVLNAEKASNAVLDAFESSRFFNIVKID